jgi:nicotinamidase-related amidase
MKDVLILIDVLNDFEHENGEELHDSFRERLPALVEVLGHARDNGTPVVYVNDHGGSWNADRATLVRRALSGRGGDQISGVVPRSDEPVLIKPRYSAFDHTALEPLLRELEAERLLLVGTATEGCIVQTGIDARELGFKVTILTAACSTVDEAREEIALRYAEEVAGIYLADGVAP